MTTPQAFGLAGIIGMPVAHSRSPVIHNYWLKRSDGSTAAERFFEVPHDDLFEWLLDHMALPLRPAVPAAPLPAAA